MRNTLILLFLLVPLGFFFPDEATSLKPSIPYLLGIIMFLMGSSLSFEDLGKALKSWKWALLGVLLQFTLMPVLALCSGVVFGWESPLLTGMLLVGCCPGGTASNVIVYLGKGNVALSILMTFCSTLLAPILTPLLLNMTGGILIAFDTWAMFLSILKIVILPLLLGIFVIRFLPKIAQKLQFTGAFVSSICIAVIIAIVLGLNHERLVNEFPLVCFLAVIGHNLLGYVVSFTIIWSLSKDKKTSFTIATEVAMQNSGLAVSLAREFFAAVTIIALPGALFSLWHNISGVVIATLRVKKEP